MQLIGLSGKARVGKDTAASYLTYHGFQRIAFADPLKDACSAMFGVPRAEFDDAGLKERLHPYWAISRRVMAQKLGTEGGRNVFGDDLWLKRAHVEIMKIAEQGFAPLRIVVTDVRFANEADWVRAKGGKVVQITRPGVSPVSAHSSENGIPWALVDETVINDSDLDTFRRRLLVACGFTDISTGDAA